MSKNSQTIRVLNRLTALHHRSLAAYLSYAKPWWARTEGRVMDTLAQVASDQQAMYDRLGGLITELGGDVDQGEFPLAFTALNDVACRYVLCSVIGEQRELIKALAAAMNDLNGAPLARALAEEASGEAQAHLDMLEELAVEPAAQA